MKRRIISVVVVFALILSFIPTNVLSVAAADASHTVDATTATTRTNALINGLVGKYFTTSQASCGNSCCDQCKNSNVIGTSWLKNTMGLVPDSASLLPEHYYSSSQYITSTAWSCAGFANYCLWYIYAQNPSDNIRRVNIYTGTFTKSNMDNSGVRTGDVIRVDDHHSFVYISHDSSGVTVLDSNWDSSRHNLVQKHVISWSWRSGTAMAITRGKNWSGTHSHSYSQGYEAAHPHRIYMKCSCGDYYYTGETTEMDGCSYCDSRYWVMTVWASEKGSGYEHDECPKITEGSVGTSYYIWYKLYDTNTGDLYNVDVDYTATVSIYNPDGSLLFSYDYANSATNWIRVTPRYIGTYRMNISLSGDISASFDSYFEVSCTATASFDKSSMTLTLPTNTSSTLQISLNGNWPTNAGYYFEYDDSVVSYSQDGTVLTITAIGEGTTDFTMLVVDKNNDNALITSTSCTIVVRDERYTALSVNASYNTDVSVAGGIKYFMFTPTTSGTYVIYSTSSQDTKVYLYDSDGKELASNDDGGEGYNFRLEYNMNAGITYKYGIRYYSSSMTGMIPFTFGRAYTVSYNANGGMGAPSSQTKDYGTTLALSSVIPTRSGYTFLGWSPNSTAAKAMYQPNEAFMANTNTVLYAVWEKNTTLGDIDLNGSINMVDVMTLYQSVSKGKTLTAEQQAAADLNGDGTINVRDAMKLYQIVSTGAK